MTFNAVNHVKQFLNFIVLFSLLVFNFSGKLQGSTSNASQAPHALFMRSTYHISKDSSYSVIYELRYHLKSGLDISQMEKVKLGPCPRTEVLDVQVFNARGVEEKDAHSAQEKEPLKEGAVKSHLGYLGISFKKLQLHQRVYIKYRCTFPLNKEADGLFSLFIEGGPFTFPFRPALKVTPATEFHYSFKSPSKLFMQKWDPSQALTVKEEKVKKSHHLNIFLQLKKEVLQEYLLQVSHKESWKTLSGFYFKKMEQNLAKLKSEKESTLEPEKKSEKKSTLKSEKESKVASESKSKSKANSESSLQSAKSEKLTESAESAESAEPEKLAELEKSAKEEGDPLKQLIEKAKSKKELQGQLDVLLHALLSRLHPLPQYTPSQWEQVRSYKLIFNEPQKPVTPVENALLLIALMKSLSIDFEVYLTVPSKMQNLESPLPYNHFERILLKVKGRENTFWLDPSWSVMALNHLPRVQKNQKALLIFPLKGEKLVSLFSSHNPYSFISIEQELQTKNLFSESDTFVEGKAQIAGNLLLSLYGEDSRKDPSFLNKYLQKLLFFNDGLSSFLLSDPPDLYANIHIPNEMEFPFRYKPSQVILKVGHQTSYLILPYFILGYFMKYNEKKKPFEGALKYQKKTIFPQQPIQFSTHLECKVSSPWLDLRREVLPYNSEKQKSEVTGSILWEWFFIKSKKASLEDRKSKAYGDFVRQLKKCLSYSSLIFNKEG